MQFSLDPIRRLFYLVVMTCLPPLLHLASITGRRLKKCGRAFVVGRDAKEECKKRALPLPHLTQFGLIPWHCAAPHSHGALPLAAFN